MNAWGGTARSVYPAGYTTRPPCLLISARPGEALVPRRAGRVVRVAERAKVGPGKPELRMLADAQQMIDVGRSPVTVRLRAQRVAIQVQGSQALPVGTIATRCGALAVLIERGLAVPLAISA